jgi:hypothetical protein
MSWASIKFLASARRAFGGSVGSKQYGFPVFYGPKVLQILPSAFLITHLWGW